MLQIMNAALLTQGFDEIVAVEDGSDEFRVLARNWPMIVERELEDGKYRFTRREVVLNNRSAGAYGFADSYLLPSTTLHVRRAWEVDAQGSRRELHWTQDGNHIHVTAEAGITVECFDTVGVELWTANFAYGVQKRLEAVLCRVKEEPGAAQQAEQEAEVAFQRARTHSAQSRSPVPAYRQSPYARARFRLG